MQLTASLLCPVCERPDPGFHTDTAPVADDVVVLFAVVGRCPDHGPWRNTATVVEWGKAVRGEEGPDGRGREVLGLLPADRKTRWLRHILQQPQRLLDAIAKRSQR